MPDPEWMARAACRGTDPDLFFPDPGGTEEAAAARAVCARCVVSASCLDHAISKRETMGVWGGTTEKERRPMRRAAPRPAPITLTCRTCRQKFVSPRAKRAFCSTACRDAFADSWAMYGPRLPPLDNEVTSRTFR